MIELLSSTRQICHDADGDDNYAENEQGNGSFSYRSIQLHETLPAVRGPAEHRLCSEQGNHSGEEEPKRKHNQTCGDPTDQLRRIFQIA